MNHTAAIGNANLLVILEMVYFIELIGVKEQLGLMDVLAVLFISTSTVIALGMKAFHI